MGARQPSGHLATRPSLALTFYVRCDIRILKNIQRRCITMPHLKLDEALVDEARALAWHIVEPVLTYISAHTTVAVERATLRLLGIDGVDEEGVPLPNRVVERAFPLLAGGILRPFVAAMLAHGLDAQEAAEAVGQRTLALQEVPEAEREAVEAEAQRLVREGVGCVRARRAEREAMIAELGNPPTPWLYLIVQPAISTKTSCRRRRRLDREPMSSL